MSASNQKNEKKDLAIFEDIIAWKSGDSSLSELLSFDCYHFHNVIELGICESGDGVSEVDGRREDFGAGDILIVFPFQHHRNYSNKEAKERCKVRWTFIELSNISGKLGFKDFFLFEMMQEISVFGVIKKSVYPSLYDMLDSLLSAVIKSRGRYRSLTIYSTLSLALIKMTELSEHSPGDKVKLPDKFHAVSPALDFLNEKIRKGELPSVTELAETVKMPLSTFRRTFGDIMNMSPKKYIIYAAVQHACFLLISTSNQISAIAEAAGFTELSTFGRVFRTVTGMTPKEYRARTKKYI